MAKRRSLFSPEHCLLPQNDDSLEQNCRLSLSSPSVRNIQRKSLGSPCAVVSDMMVHFTHCLKLSSENKINTGNAFQLEMIDYMMSMLKSKDKKLDNFQLASFTLDASTKIYASRVDKVHSDGMKIAGGLFKASIRKVKHCEESEEAADIDDVNECKVKQRARGKRKKILLADPESLTAPLQQNYKLHPSFMFMKAKFGDCRPGFVNFLSRIFVMGDSQKLQFLCSEIAIERFEANSQNQPEITLPTLQDLKSQKITHHRVEPVDFMVGGLAMKINQCKISDDLDLPSVTEKLKMELHLENNFPENVCQGSFSDTHIGEYEGHHGDAADTDPKQPPDFDICAHLSSKPLEYSYFTTAKLALWRGPSHWKLFYTKVKVEGATKLKKKRRPRKEVKDLFTEESIPDVSDKFEKSKNTKLAKRTTQRWREANITSQVDVHFDVNQFRRLFIKANVFIKFKNEQNEPKEKIEPVDDDGTVEYDYGNPNDTLEYCPDVADDSKSSEDADTGERQVKEAQDYIDNEWKLLTPPPMAEKLSLPYAREPKKIDMAKLKGKMWSKLQKFAELDPGNLNVENQEIAGIVNRPEGMVTHFKKLLYATRTAWPAETRAELSFAIIFQALLHLTNEKQLRLQSTDDLNDVIICYPKNPTDFRK